MKRTVSLILILSLIFCCIIDSANAEDGLPFSGIHWGDTEESVHKKLGGRITHVGKHQHCWTLNLIQVTYTHFIRSISSMIGYI